MVKGGLTLRERLTGKIRRLSRWTHEEKARTRRTVIRNPQYQRLRRVVIAIERDLELLSLSKMRQGARRTVVIDKAHGLDVQLCTVERERSKTRHERFDGDEIESGYHSFVDIEIDLQFVIHHVKLSDGRMLPNCRIAEGRGCNLRGRKHRTGEKHNKSQEADPARALSGMKSSPSCCEPEIIWIVH